MSEAPLPTLSTNIKDVQERRKPEARTYPQTMKVIITVALIALLGAAFAIPEVDEELNETAEHVVARCGNYCRFKFCDGQEAFLIGAPEISLTDAICHKRGRSIGLVSETGEAQVSRGRRPLKDISRYRPNGLSQRFSPSFFKSYTRPVTGTSGVGHETPRGNQVRFLDDLCVVVPIKKYQVLRPNGSIKREVSTERVQDCVEFQTIVPNLLVELTWNTADDLDLYIREPGPNGRRLYYARRRNPLTGGELLEDDNVGVCETEEEEDGLERTVYAVSDNPPAGIYKFKIRHPYNCGHGRTRYRLRAFCRGREVLNEVGSSNKNNNALVAKFRVNIDPYLC